MYFPFLRGSQYNLIALREFASGHNGCDKIFPVIEPVRVSTASILKAIDILSDSQMRYAVILNPEHGDFQLSSNRFDIQSFLETTKGLSVRPTFAFLVKENQDEVLNTIVEKDLRDVMIIFQEPFDLDKSHGICNDERVSFIVVADADTRSIRRKLMATGKHIIRLDDNFIVRKTNIAYRDVDEEAYTDEFRYYAEDGFFGFSDYCALPKSFSEGISTHTTIAMHMTFLKQDDCIWVRHFVSDAKYDDGDIRQKFMDVVSKVADFYGNDNKTPAIQELIDSKDHFPGLGVIKKLTIRNHMELIMNLLSDGSGYQRLGES